MWYYNKRKVLEEAIMSATTSVNGDSSSGSTPISTTTSSAVTGNTATGGTAGGSNGDVNKQTVTSLEDLKTKSPELYKAMIEGIAQNICRKMQKNQERIKKLMREGKS